MNLLRPARYAASMLLLVWPFVVCEALAVDDDDATETPVILHGPPAPLAPAVISRDEMGRVTMRATRIADPIVLDGKLDDAPYAIVPSVSDFIQQEPHEGRPATEKTEAWVFFDDKNVYISARCWDSHPERIVANEIRRDHRDIFQNANFTVVLDTFYDRRNGVFFQTNPLGAIREQSVSDEGLSNNNDWNTVWDVKASMDAEGWTVEMAIPFKSLRYKKGREQIWSINLRRTVRWKNEDSFLSPVKASHRYRGIYHFSEAATLVGIQAPVSSRNLELKPYAISSVITDVTEDPPVRNDLNGDVGFDLKYGLTKGLIADLTYNTDFAQVEADEQQVNLTRFSLFFPEKREFFLEGQNIFVFGGRQLRGGGGFRRGGGNTPNVTPIMFFSRRIGLTDGGVDPIIAGGRVTGRAGKFRVGALNIQTNGIEGGIDPTNFTVMRARRDVLGRSDIGFIATHRTTSVSESGLSNSLLGIDGNFAFYTNLRVNAYYAVTQTRLAESSLSGDESSYLGKLDYNGDRYGLRLEHLKVGESFRPELGFLGREAFRRSFGQARFSPRARSIDSIRRFVFQGELDYFTGEPTGRVETRRLQGQFKIEFAAGDEATVEYNKQYELLPEEFEISDGIILPVGGYDFEDVRFVYRFGPQRSVPGFASFRAGAFFGGDRKELSYNGRIEITTKFSLEPRLSMNFVDLPQGDFTTNLISTRVNYTLSPRMFVSGLFQFSSSSNSLSSNVRLRWEYQPGSDLFVVYSDGRETGLDGFPMLLNRTFAVKFTRLFRF